MSTYISFIYFYFAIRSILYKNDIIFNNILPSFVDKDVNVRHSKTQKHKITIVVVFIVLCQWQWFPNLHRK